MSELGRKAQLSIAASTMNVRRLLVVFLLGFSSGLPFALLGGTLQAWFSISGLSVMTTGMLSLLGLPYAYRTFFAPLVDRFNFFKIGRRRSWMLLTQSMLLLGFNGLAWCHPFTTPLLIIWVAAGLSLCSALQDVAVDAQRIEYLSVQDYGLGASLAVLGYRVAMLIGGGGALILAHYEGWAWTYRIMGFCMMIGWLAAWFSEEPVATTELPLTNNQLHLADWIAPIRDWFQRPYAWVGLGFIFCFKLGEMFTGSSSGIVMPFFFQGLGFSLEMVGYVNKIGGVLALLMGGVLAGWLLRTISLFQALLWFGVLQAFSTGLFLILAMVGKVTWLFILAVFVENWVAGMGATALTALLMRLVNQQFTATQFSFLVAVTVLPRIFSGPLAAWLYAHVGWIGVYTWAFACSWLFLPFLFQLQRTEEGLAPQFSPLHSPKP